MQYGQQAGSKELVSVYAVSRYYEVPLSITRFDGKLVQRNYEFVGRNALLVLLACSQASVTVSHVALGIHAGTPYYDCSPSFVRELQTVLDGYFSGTVTLEVPFLTWTKPEVYSYCSRNGLPVHLTYSCQRGDDVPCGSCPSCQDRNHYQEALS